MVQPPFIGPTMSFFSTRAPVKKVSHWPRGAGDHLDRPRLDLAGLMHVDQHEADALVLLGLRVGAHQAEAPVGVLGAGGPDLLAVDLPVVALVLAAWSASERGRSRRWARSSPGTSAARRCTIGGRWRCFWSSVPYSSRVAPNMPGPMPWIGLVTPMRAISCCSTRAWALERPPPPYSFGQVGVPQPFSPMRLRQRSCVARWGARRLPSAPWSGRAACARDCGAFSSSQVARFVAEGFEVGSRQNRPSQISPGFKCSFGAAETPPF